METATGTTVPSTTDGPLHAGDHAAVVELDGPGQAVLAGLEQAAADVEREAGQPGGLVARPYSPATSAGGRDGRSSDRKE